MNQGGSFWLGHVEPHFCQPVECCIQTLHVSEPFGAIRCYLHGHSQTSVEDMQGVELKARPLLLLERSSESRVSQAGRVANNKEAG